MYCRRGVDYGTQLYSLRAVGKRRHTTLMFEGVPTYPDASRFWQVVDKTQREYLLHRPNSDSGVNEPRERSSGGYAPFQFKAARHRRRTD